MNFKLEQVINETKEPRQILDFSKIKINSRQELATYFGKVPEFDKIRREKVRAEDALCETEFSFKRSSRRKFVGRKSKQFEYRDPCPSSMRSVRQEDLVEVDTRISWKMLTVIRPKSLLDEDFFGRLVELGRWRFQTRSFEAEQEFKTNKNRSILAPIKMCSFCELEFCTGLYCKEFLYDFYSRNFKDEDIGGERVKRVKFKGTHSNKPIGKRVKKKRKGKNKN